MCLQELRFGSSGIREIYNRCQSNREALQETLESLDVKVEAPRGSLDLVIEDVQLSKTTQAGLGLKRLGGDSYLATVQLGVTKQDVTKLASKLVN
jgi:glycine cleavage system pyridoxal-binding protein P